MDEEIDIVLSDDNDSKKSKKGKEKEKKSQLQDSQDENNNDNNKGKQKEEEKPAKSSADTEVGTIVTTGTLASVVVDEQKLQEVAAEWDEVEKLQKIRQAELQEQESKGENKGIAGYKKAKSPMMVDWLEAREYFTQLDLTEQKKNIVVEDNRGRTCLQSLFYSCCGAPKYKNTEAANTERETIFAIAQLPFNNEDKMHNKVLQTVYMKLTGSQLDCPRFGNHWETIGFQGNDPATDLRGVGMFGLLQLLYFLKYHSKLASDIYLLSRDESQNFPFCVASLSLTRVTLEALREGCLVKLHNRLASNTVTLIDVVNEVHCACFNELYQIWKREQKAIADYSFVLKRVTAKAKTDAVKLVDEFRTSQKEPKADSEGFVEFTPLS